MLQPNSLVRVGKTLAMIDCIQAGLARVELADRTTKLVRVSECSRALRSLLLRARFNRQRMKADQQRAALSNAFADVARIAAKQMRNIRARRAYARMPMMLGLAAIPYRDAPLLGRRTISAEGRLFIALCALGRVSVAV
jgi:hypothetical protein